jgi:hypothetical protein
VRGLTWVSTGESRGLLPRWRTAGRGETHVLSDPRRCRCPRVPPRCPSSLMSWVAACFCSNQLLRGPGTRVCSPLLVCCCVRRGLHVAPGPRLAHPTLSAGVEPTFACCTLLEPCCDPPCVRKVGLLCYLLFCGSFLTGPYLAGFQLGLVFSRFWTCNDLLQPHLA